jgi:hypothetical protein
MTVDAAPAVTWTGKNGWYESSRGHVVASVGRRWFITEPGEWTPDAERPSLREAKAYVELCAAENDDREK